MADFDLSFIEDSSESATSAGTVITAGAANTKGSYVELIASTASDCKMLKLTIIGLGVNITEALIDIATGSVASEVDVISNQKYYCDIVLQQIIVNFKQH